MWEESAEIKRPLRTGFSTGACATACSVAAARCLLQLPVDNNQVLITLPKGQRVSFSLVYCRVTAQGAEAATIKDAGDDPDVTHGALIMARVELTAEPGILFRAGTGVGTVTLPGLSLAVGEAAINPVPRAMMHRHLTQMAQESNYPGGFSVTIGVENGAQLALKTMNGRLGIVGGLSILGTTGIVKPFSCSAYIASIHQSMDVAHALGIDQLVAVTGSVSESAIKQRLSIPDQAVIEMGDFVGAVLKYLKPHFKRLSVVGGIAKIVKLAHGAINLHSRDSQHDFEWLAHESYIMGLSEKECAVVRQAHSVQQIIQTPGFPVTRWSDYFCRLARQQVLSKIPCVMEVEIWACDRQGQLIGHAA